MRATRDVILQVGDLDAAAQFYAETLGLPVTTRSAQLVGFEAGAFQLFIEPGATPYPVFEFLADDFAASKARLLAAGCVVVDEDPSVPRCYLKDPFGLVFNLAGAR